LVYTGITDFDNHARRIAELSENNKHKIYALVTLAKDADEASAISEKIRRLYQNHPTSRIVVIDSSKTALGKEDFSKWVEYKATSEYYAGKDNAQSTQYDQYAKKVLHQWRGRIKDGQFLFYTTPHSASETVNGTTDLVRELQVVDIRYFPYCLEQYSVIDNMWKMTAMKAGAENGVKQQLAGTFKSTTDATKLEKALDGAWQVERYWETNPSLPISRIKIFINALVDEKMQNEGRISIRTIYESLKGSPWGFMPCNFTAFVMGFLLKEYILSKKYTWSDNISSDELTMEKFKEMVDEVIKLDITDNSRYKDKYIVTQTDAEKAFLDASVTAFHMSRSLCSSVENVRERIRGRMKELLFPIWTLEHILDGESLKTERSVILDLINLYCSIANNNQDETGQSDNDFATSIGRMCIINEHAAQDLSTLLTKDKCTAGMEAYLRSYRAGTLIELAKEVDDNGHYINVLRGKFNADAANWVWKKETVDLQIDDVIVEYRIVVDSNKIVEVTKRYEETINAWNAKCGNLRLSYNAIKDCVG
jgi:hypothetical protein